MEPKIDLSPSDILQFARRQYGRACKSASHWQKIISNLEKELDLPANPSKDFSVLFPRRRSAALYPVAVEIIKEQGPIAFHELEEEMRCLGFKFASCSLKQSLTDWNNRNNGDLGMTGRGRTASYFWQGKIDE